MALIPSRVSTPVLLVGLAILFSSCLSNRKIVYLPQDKLSYGSLTQISNSPGAYRLQPRDIVSIRVKTLDSESADYFNIQPENGFFNFNLAAVFLNSYSLDENGAIHLPEVGRVELGGLDLLEAQNRVQEVLKKYLNKATIILKLVSFKVTILGEVRNPGHFYVYNNQLTILEGLGMAGDLTDFGNRQNVTLIRQNTEGFAGVHVNLQDPNLLSSKYFFLQPNDVLYVQPLKAKARRGNVGTLNALSLIFGAVSTTILILNYVN